VWIQARGQAMWDNDGKPYRMSGAHTDIMERKKAEKALRNSEERYRTVVEQSSECIFLVDIESRRVLHTNVAMQKLLGYTGEELMNLTLYDFVAHDKKNIDDNIKVLFKNKKSFIGERKYKTKDESIVDVEVSVSLLNFRDKNVFCIVARDIRERKFAERALKKAHQELEDKVEKRTLELRELHEEKDKFISRASHDLRTPIAAILGFSELLVELKWGELKSDQKAKINKIKSHADRLNSIVDDLLNVSRIEAGVIGKSKASFDVSSLINKVIEEMKDIISVKSQNITYTNLSDGYKVIGDLNSINQILTNLIDNASKYNHEKGEISISSKSNDSVVKISVKDTGIGLAEGDRNHIFDEFYRVEKSGEVRIQGTGLGLTIVKRLANQMDGDVKVESEGLGKGSTFILSLPLEKKGE
tara:strand:- start:3703 stop:4950 length:1248 start_codon:yes stop_codon:yes gene_type:complete